jgi:DNA-binding NarL/FixJ family response regulator
MPSKTVLIIDDHAPFRTVARELLERRGFVVVAEDDGAATGFEAVAAVAPDAVVLDIHLGDGNGIDVCRALTEANPALVVLLISADTHHGQCVGECGAVGFVAKARLGSPDVVGLPRGGAAEGRAARTTGDQDSTSRSVGWMLRPPRCRGGQGDRGPSQ